MTADDFRALVLALDGVEEHAHMGHPDFRLNGRIFAGLSAQADTGRVKLSPDEQAAFLADHPTAFTPAAGAWGRQGWTVVQLLTAPAPALRGALLLAWEGAGRQAAAGKRTAARRAPGRRT